MIPDLLPGTWVDEAVLLAVFTVLWFVFVFVFATVLRDTKHRKREREARRRELDRQDTHV